jgi:hypothetical protein
VNKEGRKKGKKERKKKEGKIIRNVKMEYFLKVGSN